MKAIEIGTFEAKNRLSGLLDQVERGQRVYITRRGHRVALLTSALEGAELSGASGGSDLVAEFRAIRATAKAGVSSLRAMVEEGRRA